MENPYRLKTDFEIKILLAEDKSSFREGYYSLLLEEAKIRKLLNNEEKIGSKLDKYKEEINQDNKNKNENNLLKFGYVFSFFGGIIGFIIALNILISKKYDKKIKKHGIIMIILSVFMTIIGWQIIIIVLKFLAYLVDKSL